MKEASPVKFYFAKYFFLALGLLQWVCGILLFLNDAEKSKRAALLFFLLGLMFIALYFMVAGKLRRVAVGKNRIAVMGPHKTDHYEWPEVKWIKVVPFFNLYKLKLRGKKERIYFLPEHNVEPLYGLFPHEAELVEVMKKKSK